MIKRIIFTMLLAFGLSVGQAQAGEWEKNCDNEFFGQILNECGVEKEVTSDYEAWDYGGLLDIVLLEAFDSNVAIRSWNTYEVRRNEITTLLGVTVYLNRMLYQKPE